MITFRKIIMISVLMGYMVTAQAQSITDFVFNSENRNYASIIESFEQSIIGLGKEEKQKKRKHFYRLMRFYEATLDQNGEITNYLARNMKAMKQAERSVPGFMDDTDRATHGQWEDISPLQFDKNYPQMGRAIRLAAHPTDLATIFVGTPNGGMWKSSNYGNTWTNLTHNLPSMGVSGMAIHPSNPNIMYILTGDGDGMYNPSTGIYRTTNGGIDWQPTSLVFEEHSFRRATHLRMHPDDPNIMYATTSLGLYKTTDGWNTHQRYASLLDLMDIELAPYSPDTMYISSKPFSPGTATRVFRSTDGGQNLTELSITDTLLASETPSRIEIATTEAYPAVVYVLLAWNSPEYFELYASTDYGDTFTQQSTGNFLGGQVSLDLTMEVDPYNHNIVYIGGVPLFKSIDGGATFSNITTGQNGTEIHPDIHDLLFHGGFLYSATHGGVCRTSDGGANWTRKSYGLNIMLYTDIDVFQNQFIGGTQDNGTQRWTIGDFAGLKQTGADGFECQFDRGGSGIVYTSTQDDRWLFQPGDLEPTPAEDIITPPGLSNTWDAAWAFHPTRTDTSYTFTDFMYRTYDQGENWETLYVGLPDQKNIRAVAQGVSNPDFMYVSDRKEIAFTTNVHASNPVWINVTGSIFTSTANGYEAEQIGSIAVDPEDPFTVWVTMFGYGEGYKVYKSTIAGQNDSWVNMSDNLPNVPIRASVCAPGPENGIYVGTDIGVFYRDDNMQEWIWFGNGLPKSTINDMVISDGYLYVGTFGRGAWRSPLYSNCPSVILLNENTNPDPNGLDGILEYASSSSISSNQQVYGGPGTDVRFSAGNFVTLYDGFTVKPNTTFEAKIGGCPQ